MCPEHVRRRWAVTERLSMCCFRCDLCLAHKDSIARKDMRQELSDGWLRFFGFRIPPERIACDGCTADSNAVTLDTGCPVRPCVIERGLANCSECADYPCDRIRERLIVFEDLTAGMQVSETDREQFIRPYENRARIEKLREGKKG
jgi:hypothetical protein